MSESYTLSDALAEMERTNPDVRKASIAYDVMVSRLLGCEHLLPCKPGRCSGVYNPAPSATQDEPGKEGA